MSLSQAQISELVGLCHTKNGGSSSVPADTLSRLGELRADELLASQEVVARDLIRAVRDRHQRVIRQREERLRPQAGGGDDNHVQRPQRASGGKDENDDAEQEDLEASNNDVDDIEEVHRGGAFGNAMLGVFLAPRTRKTDLAKFLKYIRPHADRILAEFLRLHGGMKATIFISVDYANKKFPEISAEPGYLDFGINSLHSAHLIDELLDRAERELLLRNEHFVCEKSGAEIRSILQARIKMALLLPQQR